MFSDKMLCHQCPTWNDCRRDYCTFCDAPRPRTWARTEIETETVTRCSGEEELDEFGRKKGSSPKPSGPRWPPPFDRRSSTYVFDARSGMFYHASSQFFFDPKTKLYYGNKEQKYYVHCKDAHPHFRELESQPIDSAKIEQETKVEQKPLISISLKTKVLASSEKAYERTKKAEAPASQAVSRVRKQHASNIDRWSERGREIAGKGPVVRTKAGHPVCLLCKRKFSDLQKLERHEDLSEMHKANVSTSGKRVKLIEETAAAAFARDRALERRVLHGDDVDLPGGRLLQHFDNAVAATAPEPQEILDESHIGNKMLQKLGWKSGTNLGRASGTDAASSTLRKDWERIEQLAKQGNS